MDTPLVGACRLVDRGVIRATGPDAASFLQGQLTNDVLAIGPEQARLAGFCSAKGRLQASFVVWRPGREEFLLACPASVLGPTLKRLSMFVLRAKCKLTDASAELELWGIAGAPAEALAANLRPWQRQEHGGRDTGGGVGAADVGAGDGGVGEVRGGGGGGGEARGAGDDGAAGRRSVVRLPDAAGIRRALVAAPAGSNLLDEGLPELPLATWQWLEVQSGIVAIEAATVDRFVPQMVNFEKVGGVDFGKGCYPGQEVVARSQYRGTTKRRTFLFDSDALAQPGQDVFAGGDGGEPAGTVANAAPNPDGRGGSALVELRLAALDAPSLHLGTSDGPLLRRAELPYPLALDPEPAG